MKNKEKKRGVLKWFLKLIFLLLEVAIRSSYNVVATRSSCSAVSTEIS